MRLGHLVRFNIQGMLRRILSYRVGLRKSLLAVLPGALEVVGVDKRRLGSMPAKLCRLRNPVLLPRKTLLPRLLLPRVDTNLLSKNFFQVADARLKCIVALIKLGHAVLQLFLVLDPFRH